MKPLLATITLLLSINAFAAPKPRTVICDFDGDNASQVWQIFTAPGIGTTFRLPEGVNIADFVVTDPRNFHAESNGTIGIVTPLSAGKSTSVSIYTDNDRLYVFNLSSEPQADIDQLVVIQAASGQLFKQRVRDDARKIAEERIADAEARHDADLERESDQVRRRMIFSIDSNYRITGNLFSIDKVSDDGVFTYVRLARSQERPVVYLGDAKDPKRLEPVRYTDEGDHYVIHRVLAQGDKGFVLKLGDRTGEIRKNR
jgi:type IV secretory pathway VirB9-like protein